MPNIKFFKVNNLPAALEANSIYLVDAIDKAEFFVTDNSGVNARKLYVKFSHVTPFPKQTNKYKIANEVTARDLVNIGLVRNRFYLIPFSVPRRFTINEIALFASNPNASSTTNVGIYNTTTSATGDDIPYQLLASGSIATTSYGIKKTTVNFTFKEAELYWLGVVCNQAIGIRAVHKISTMVNLGRDMTNTLNAITHIYYNGNSNVLPTDASTLTYVNGKSKIPAFLLKEE